MAIAKQIIYIHVASISIESIIGIGTTLTLVLNAIYNFKNSIAKGSFTFSYGVKFYAAGFSGSSLFVFLAIIGSINPSPNNTIGVSTLSVIWKYHSLE